MTCDLTVAPKTATPPTGYEPSILIKTPTVPPNGDPLNMYKDKTVKISGTYANMTNITVTANGVNVPGIKTVGNTFEVTYKPESSGIYIFRATGTATHSTTSPSSQITVSLVLNDDGNNNSASSATMLENGTERISAINSENDVDYFSFRTSKVGTYEIMVTSSIALQKTFGKDGTIGTPFTENKKSISISANDVDKVHILQIQAVIGTEIGVYTVKISTGCYCQVKFPAFWQTKFPSF